LYAIPPGATSAEVTLYYQSTSKEFMEFLRDENTTNSKGQEMYDLWNDNGKCPPEIMAQAQITLTVEECPGDLDGDNDVDLADLAQLLGNYGTTSGAVYEDGDLDGDGDVDLADLAALLGVYGTTCP
jgi:hypothetical protein